MTAGRPMSKGKTKSGLTTIPLSDDERKIISLIIDAGYADSLADYVRKHIKKDYETLFPAGRRARLEEERAKLDRLDAGLREFEEDEVRRLEEHHEDLDAYISVADSAPQEPVQHRKRMIGWITGPRWKDFTRLYPGLAPEQVYEELEEVRSKRGLM